MVLLPYNNYDKECKVDKGSEEIIHVHVNFFDENFISTALKKKNRHFGCWRSSGAIPPSRSASQNADHTQLFAAIDKDVALRSQGEFLPPK